MLVYLNSTVTETRAYYFFNLKQGSATYEAFVEEFKSAEKCSTKNFQKNEFNKTLNELMN